MTPNHQVYIKSLSETIELEHFKLQQNDSEMAYTVESQATWVI